MPMFDPVVLEIGCDILHKQDMFFPLKHVVSMESLNNMSVNR